MAIFHEATGEWVCWITFASLCLLVTTSDSKTFNLASGVPEINIKEEKSMTTYFQSNKQDLQEYDRVLQCKIFKLWTIYFAYNCVALPVPINFHNTAK